MARLGKCPDCNYEPISVSCNACPKCGCQEFILAIGPKEERICPSCHGEWWSKDCEECYGKGKHMFVQVKDFRSGETYWYRDDFKHFDNKIRQKFPDN